MKTLRELWTSKGLTEEDIAVKADVSLRTVSRANKGQHVSTRMLRRVCTALDITVEQYRIMYTKSDTVHPQDETAQNI
jgi:transcriptional regulator with XRE-family HTH domain